MKSLTKILSILIAILGILAVISSFDNGSMNNEFFLKAGIFSLYNILPFFSIALCCYCLERNDTNYLVRIIPMYLMIPIVLSFFVIFLEIESGIIVDLYSFLCCMYLEILGLSLILVIKPNNAISSFVRSLSYILCAIGSIMIIYLHFNNGIPNFSNFLSSTFDTFDKFDILNNYLIIVNARIFTTLVLYISNYAFSEKIEIETEDIDYDVIKEEAKELANAQMNSIYNLDAKKNEPDRSASDKGLMNVNNQLGQNSNVGTVKEQAREVNVAGSTLDSLMPLSKGPVINETVQEKKEEVAITTPVQAEPKVEETIPPNLDIQEQMRLRAEQANKNNINQNINQ